MFSHKNTNSYTVQKQNKFFVSGLYTVITILFYFFYFASVTQAATSVDNSNANLISNGLVGYWTFDGQDMTNATATDISGQGNNGTLTNMTSWSGAAIGKLGQALNFTGGTAVVSVANNSALNMTSQISISAWVKRVSLGSRQFLVSKGSATSNANTQYWLEITSSNYLVFQLSNGSTPYTLTSTNTFTDTLNWHHITGTWDGSVIRLYVDGVQDTNTLAFTGSITTAGDDLALGNRSYFYNIPYIGKLDDVRIYNRALTATEVQTLYKAGGGITAGYSSTTLSNLGLNNGLAGYWTFDGKYMTNATATDLSGNGNNGTLTNMTAASAVTLGKLGQTLNFDGVNDYVLTGLTTHYPQTTFSTWIYPLSLGEGNLGRIIDKRENGGTESIYFALNGSNRLIFGRPHSSATNANWLTPVNSITLNAWNHVVVTYDDTSTANDPVMYINGVVQTLSESQAPVGTPITNLDRYIIGNRGDTTRTFNGKIDDLRIYSRLLSAMEVQSLYKLGQTVAAASPTNNTGTGINSGLVGLWNLDGKNMTATTALDVSGNGNTGTLTNMTTKGNAVIGKMGQALNFNGSNNYFTIPTASLSAFSFSFWTKTASPSQIGIILGDSSGTSGGGNKIGFSGGSVFLRAGGSMYTVTAMPTDSKWHHWVVTRDQSNSWILYKDNVATVIGTSPGSSTYNLTTVGANGGDKSQLWNGGLDDVRVYNRALTSSEVTALYKLGQ